MKIFQREKLRNFLRLFVKRNAAFEHVVKNSRHFLIKFKLFFYWFCKYFIVHFHPYVMIMTQIILNFEQTIKCIKDNLSIL